jgi:SAM domain (Sterile alpha motif)
VGYLTSAGLRTFDNPKATLDTFSAPADDARHPRLQGAVMDIVVWLRSLGLGKYEAAFRENEIDETVLPSLTEEHLKQLGVTALGHRVKLLDAIAALRNDASGKTPSLTQRPRRVPRVLLPKTAPSAVRSQ